MADIKSLALGKEQTEGRWVPYVEDIEFLIARWNNPAHRSKQHKLSKPHLRQIRKQNTKVGEQVARKAMVGTVLLDWKNIEDNGEPIPFSVEKALEYMTDPAYEHLYTFILGEAMDDEAYMADVIEESAGN